MEIFIFFILMYISVFLHELGHFLSSKIFNIKVYEFSIGLGSIFYKFNLEETNFYFKNLPLGGYISYSDDEVFKLTIVKEWIIILSGVFINFLTGIISLSLVYNKNIFYMMKMFFIKIILPFSSVIFNFSDYVILDNNLNNALSSIPKLSSFNDLYFVLACINLSLVISNLLPIPILDGGQIIMSIIRRMTYRLGISRKYINKVVYIVYLLCWVLLLSPMLIKKFLLSKNHVTVILYAIMAILFLGVVLVLKQTDIYKKVSKRTF